jgi:hypothetical protein
METLLGIGLIGLVFVVITLLTSPVDETCDPISRLDPRLVSMHHH